MNGKIFAPKAAPFSRSSQQGKLSDGRYLPVMRTIAHGRDPQPMTRYLCLQLNRFAQQAVEFREKRIPRFWKLRLGRHSARHQDASRTRDSILLPALNDSHEAIGVRLH